MRECPRLIFCMRRLAAIAILGLASACSGGDDDDATPTPSPHHFVVTGPLIITEETPAIYTVQVVSTSGAATTWSGVVDVASITGPATPAQMTITNGQGSEAFTLELAGSSGGLGLVFSAPGLQPFTRLLEVQAKIPAPYAGAGTGESVFGPSASGWDRGGVWGGSVWDDGTGLSMLYAATTTGGAADIGVAQSTDGGLTWTRFARVLGPNAQVAACHVDGAENPAVFPRGDGTLGVLYVGRSASGTHLCAATSANGGFTWTPITGVEEDGSVIARSLLFDADEIRGAAVIRHDDGTLEALYSGRGTYEFDASNPGPENIVGVGVARSIDEGLTWTKAPNGPSGSVLFGYQENPAADSWESWEITWPGVQKDGPVLRAYFTGYGPGGPRIGLYETLDLSDFDAHVDNLAAEPLHEMIGIGVAGRFDEEGALLPSVLEIGGVRTIFYTGQGADGVRRIGLARCL